MLGVVSRLTVQKGFELLPDILPVLLHRENLRLIVLGAGEERYENYFNWLQGAFPGKVAFRAGFDNVLAHWIEAGADMFLMPSRYEPCGLNQMYSLRYGTVPIVRRTGGLADTVEPWNYEATRDATIAGKSAASTPATPVIATAKRISRASGMKKRYPAGRLGDWVRMRSK